MKIQYVQTNFNAGQFSKNMQGRSDIVYYRNAVASSSDLTPHLTGPLGKRSGTQFIAHTRYSNRPTRLISWYYNSKLPFMLEFGDFYVRFFLEQAPLLKNGFIYELPTPYKAEDIFNVRFTAARQQLYMTQTDSHPYVLTYDAATSDFDIKPTPIDGPYDKPVPEGVKIEWSSVLGYLSFKTDNNIFMASDVGRTIQVFSGEADEKDQALTDSYYHSALIKSYASPTQVEIEWLRPPDNGIQVWPNDMYKDWWHLSVFGDANAERSWFDEELRPYGYPSHATFNEGRLVYSDSVDAPLTLWGSNPNKAVLSSIESINTFSKFIPGYGQPDDLSYTYTLDAEVNGHINWLISSSVLAIGTDSDEWSFGQVDSTAPVTSNNVFAKRQTALGSKNVEAVKLGEMIVFVQANGRQLQGWRFDRNTYSFNGIRLNIFSEDVITSDVVEMATAVDNESRLYVVLQDGSLAVGVILPSHKINGWVKWSTAGEFKSVATTPTTVNADGNKEVWVITKRENSQGTFQFVEMFNTEYEEDTALMTYSDSALKYDGISTNVLSGLEHLEGNTVSIWADKAVFKNQVVENGEITLPVSVSKAVVGLPYAPEAITLNLEPPVYAERAYTLNGMATLRSISKIIITFEKTLNAIVGTNKNNMVRIPFRGALDLTDTGVDLFTGIKEVRVDDPMDLSSQVIIRSDTPTPMKIISIGIQMDIEKS